MDEKVEVELELELWQVAEVGLGLYGTEARRGPPRASWKVAPKRRWESLAGPVRTMPGGPQLT